MHNLNIWFFFFNISICRFWGHTVMDGSVSWRRHSPSLHRCFSLWNSRNGIFTLNLKWSGGFTWRISRDPIMTCRLQVGSLLNGTDGPYKHTLSHSSPLLHALFNSKYCWVSKPFKSQMKMKSLTGMLFASFRWKIILQIEFCLECKDLCSCTVW